MLGGRAAAGAAVAADFAEQVFPAVGACVSGDGMFLKLERRPLPPPLDDDDLGSCDRGAGRAPGSMA